MLNLNGSFWQKVGSTGTQVYWTSGPLDHGVGGLMVTGSMDLSLNVGPEDALKLGGTQFHWQSNWQCASLITDQVDVLNDGSVG